MLAAVGLVGAVAWLYETAPRGDAGVGPVDALVVLGSPAELDGSVSQVERWRVDEAVRRYRAGVAPRMVFTGGRAGNTHMEAAVMGSYAVRLGVPPTAIWEEVRARTTMENLANTVPYLKARGWTRVEVISTPEHLHRAGVMLQGTGLQWRLRPAPTPGRWIADRCVTVLEEAVGTAVLRVFGLRAQVALHGVAYAGRAVTFGMRWIWFKVEATLQGFRRRW